MSLPILRSFGSNQHVLDITTARGDISIFFSYETPVACKVRYPSGGIEYTCTDKKYSSTTSKHINAWIKNTSLGTPCKSQTDLENTISYILDLSMENK